MIVLLSPAKSLNYAPVAEQAPQLVAAAHTLPHFVQQPAQLVAAARKLSAKKLAALMDISADLAQLNVARFQAWQPEYTVNNAKPAMLAFDGDVYTGLQAATLSLDDMQWAQAHIGILSGLYGLLRPLDWIQAYRLEMGSALATKVGKQNHKNLYGFWGTQITEQVNARLQAVQADTVVNLASQEYFKAIKVDLLQAHVIDCVFEDFKNGQFKVISFFAKQARGLMARYIIDNRITQVAKLKKFKTTGYAFAPDASTPDRFVFQRQLS